MNIRSTQVLHCPICKKPGSIQYNQVNDRLYGIPGTWNIYICDFCEILWLSPQPIKEDIPKLYANYHTHSEFNKNPMGSGMREKINKYLLVEKYQYPLDNQNNLLLRLLSSLPYIQEEIGKKIMFLSNGPGKNLLDVGAGNGYYMSTMSWLGWSVTGVEPDSVAAQVAEKSTGSIVYPESFDDVFLPEASFDAITMDHVIEHLVSPLISIKKVYRLLKPGGTLVILTPNIHSLGHRHFKRNWLHLDPPRHLYLFSKKSLQTYLTKAGLETVSVTTLSSSAWWVYISSRLISRSGFIPGGNLSKKDLTTTNKLRGITFMLWEDLFRIGRSSDIYTSGEELLLIARKPNDVQS